MYQLNITIENNALEHNEIFLTAAYQLIEDLDAINELTLEKETKSIPNTRGDAFLLTNLLIKAVEIGFFGGVYMVVKDFYDRYKNAEVTLKFKDGSYASFKGLSKKEALELIADKLNKEEDA